MAKNLIHVNSWRNIIRNWFNRKNVSIEPFGPRPLYPHEKGLRIENITYNVLGFDLVPDPGFKIAHYDVEE